MEKVTGLLFALYTKAIDHLHCYGSTEILNELRKFSDVRYIWK